MLFQQNRTQIICTLAQRKTWPVLKKNVMLFQQNMTNKNCTLAQRKTWHERTASTHNLDFF